MAGSHRVVALNVGTANIIAVQGLVHDAPQGQRTAVVEKIASMPTPEGAVRSNGIHLPDVLTDALRRMWREQGFQTKNVIVAVDSRRVQSGVKWIPYMHPKDLALAAQPGWVNDQRILGRSIDPKTTTVHHFALRERQITDPTGQVDRQMLICVLAVPTTEAQALSNVVEDAGLEMVGMDLQALALLRGAALPMRNQDKRVVDMVIDVGKTLTTMVLHNSGSIRGVETVDGSGGESVTRAIGEEFKRYARETGATRVDPEDIKRQLPRRLIDSPQDPITVGALDAVRKQTAALSGDLDAFVVTYMNAVNEVGGSDGLPAGQVRAEEERGLASVALTGGGSALHGLKERLANPEDGGVNINISHAIVSNAFTMENGDPVHPWVNGVSIVSTVGLLTADRKAV